MGAIGSLREGTKHRATASFSFLCPQRITAERRPRAVAKTSRRFQRFWGGEMSPSPYFSKHQGRASERRACVDVTLNEAECRPDLALRAPSDGPARARSWSRGTGHHGPSW